MKISWALTTSWPCKVSASVLAMAALIMPGVGRAATDPCGLGLPPGAPGFSQQEAQREAEAKKNGFLRVCEANLQRYSVTFVPMATATRALDFVPVDLRTTPLARLQSLGARKETVGNSASRLYRGFRTPEGKTLTLFEHDMSADGTRLWRDPKDEPERVDGLPARLIVLQASSGRAVSVLSWRQGRRYYELWLDANAARDPMRARLFGFANSLPASVPACPNEPRPERMVLGPDGFPVDEPTLPTLTTEPMQARNGKPSCK